MERRNVSRKGKGIMAAALQRLVGHLQRWAEVQPDGEPTDRRLLERFAAQRDEAAFAEVVRRHGPMVLGVARRVLHDSHDAEDVFQATFLVLARKAASVHWHESVAGWLFPVAYRLALKARAGRERRRIHESRVATMPATESAAGLPDDELRGLLDDELSRLPEHYRNVVLLCYLEGKTQRAAGHQLGLSPGEVRGRLERARQRLRQRLTRRGLVLSGTAVSAALTAQPLAAALSTTLLRNTTRAAILFATRTAPAELAALASPAAFALARGVLNAMLVTKVKSLSILVLVASLLTAGGLLLPVPAAEGTPRVLLRAKQPAPTEPQPEARSQPAPKADDKAARRSCIILWMNGGPSQIDTFDPKPGDANGGPFKPIDTVVKGVQISEHLPRIAKMTDRLALVRSVTHDEGDHARATHLMRTGYVIDGQTDYPPLGSLLAKELIAPKADLPPYVRLASPPEVSKEGYGPGFLGPKFGPLTASPRAVPLGDKKSEAEQTQEELPLEAFQQIDKERAAAMRKATLAAFELSEEKAAVRDAYGRNAFGQGCLVARRLVERGAPVVEVTLSGWDTHARNFDLVKELSGKLDPAWATLLSDLEERKLLDHTLVVWMGEFGRTPHINANDGRDHWPKGFSVVLAGGGIKGGQVIGRTSKDGIKIEERPVSPPELLATIFQALNIDPAKENRSNIGGQLPLVLKGTKPIKEALK
jgi:RNA polymerase sigma factor (sigma-70 family)